MFDLPLQIAALMKDFLADWFVVGGWAIDLFLEEETRFHEDIEIAVFRRDQLILRNYLDGWIFQKAENQTLSIWKQDEFLELPVHEIHCFQENLAPPNFEVLLNERNDNEWIYRRNPKIAKLLNESYLTSNSGVRFLRPEIVLLYKSKNPRAKDELDFQNVVERLDAESKNWLRNALTVCDSKHLWLQKL